MANHPQAAKRNRQRIIRQAHHKHFKSAMRTTIKRLLAAVEDGKADAAQAALKIAVPMVDRCAQKGVIPKKRASRMVSRLTRRVSKIG